MIEFVAYLAAQERTADLAWSALPNAPVQPESEHGRLRGRATAVRLRISVVLRRLADRIEPAPGCREPAVARF